MEYWKKTMSKSRKKHGFVHGAGHDGSWKKIFNRRLRQNKKFNDIPDGNAYKKLNCSWNISDWPHIAPTFEEFCSYDWAKEGYSKEELKNLYERWYYRK